MTKAKGSFRMTESEGLPQNDKKRRARNDTRDITKWHTIKLSSVYLNEFRLKRASSIIEAFFGEERQKRSNLCLHTVILTLTLSVTKGKGKNLTSSLPLRLLRSDYLEVNAPFTA